MKYLIRSTKSVWFLYEHPERHPVYLWSWRESEKDATQYETKKDAEKAIADFGLRNAVVVICPEKHAATAPESKPTTTKGGAT